MVNLHITVTRQHLFAAVGTLLVLVLAVPVGVWAAGRFTDVPDSNIFQADIEWLADAGVTKGCNPPANTEFCPTDEVTREQMAAFMNRFAGFLGAQDGVVSQADNATNADTLDGIDSSGFVTEAELAAKAVVEPVAGGRVLPNGTVASSWVVINGDDWDVSRNGTGAYTISIDGLNPGCASAPVFLANLFSSFGGEIVLTSVSSICASGNSSILVQTYDSAGTLTDKNFTFVVYGGIGGLQPLDRINAEACVYDEDGITCDGQPIQP